MAQIAAAVVATYIVVRRLCRKCVCPLIPPQSNWLFPLTFFLRAHVVGRWRFWNVHSSFMPRWRFLSGGAKKRRQAEILYCSTIIVVYFFVVYVTFTEKKTGVCGTVAFAYAYSRKAHLLATLERAIGETTYNTN